MQVSVTQLVNRQVSYAKRLLKVASAASAGVEAEALLQASANALYRGLCDYLVELQWRLHEQKIQVALPGDTQESTLCFSARLAAAAVNEIPEYRELLELANNRNSWLSEFLARFWASYTAAGQSSGVVVPGTITLRDEASVGFDQAGLEQAVQAFYALVQRHRESLQYC